MSFSWTFESFSGFLVSESTKTASGEDVAVGRAADAYNTVV